MCIPDFGTINISYRGLPVRVQNTIPKASKYFENWHIKLSTGTSAKEVRSDGSEGKSSPWYGITKRISFNTITQYSFRKQFINILTEQN